MAAAKAMPIITTTIMFDDAGYPGWYAKLRLNITAYTYDDFVSTDSERELAGLRKLVIEWTFTDEEGNPVPHPREWKSYDDRKVLPYMVWNTMLEQYFEEFNKPLLIPKGLSEVSESTSTTNGRAQVTG